MPIWYESVKPDDFVVAVGQTQTNSVYHVAEVKVKEYPDKRKKRCYLKVFKSDLLTAIRREKNQRIIDVQWYDRNKKQPRDDR